MAYVNKPGGVIASLEDGTSIHLQYGDEVPDNLAEHISAEGWSDDEKRNQSEGTLAQVRESHARAAEAEAGQVNSASSPVPGNYNELDEEAKVNFVSTLDRYPELQAKVLIHEQLFGGDSREVFDAASEAAQISAKTQLSAEVNDLADFKDHTEDESVVALGDPDISPGDDEVTEAIQARALVNAKAAAGDESTPPPAAANAPVATGAGDRLENLDAQQLQAVAAKEGVRLTKADLAKDRAKAIQKIKANRAGKDEGESEDSPTQPPPL